MPELPEVEITARRLAAALTGAEVESVLAPGMVALKSVKPPLEAIVGMRVAGVRRAGKMPVVELGRGGDPELALLVHMMSAGRLQVFGRRASLRDRASRVLVRLGDGRELRLREFGSKQRAWAKLLEAGAVEDDEMVATLGPEAWPAPGREELATALDQPRHLHPLLRDQRTIAGIGRSWVDEILWEASLSPFRKGSELSADELDRLHAALHVLGDAIDHYEEVVGDTIPDKMPMPLEVHRREGEPCPRCGTTIAAIHYSDRITCYCPAEQTGGRVLADRRLSRLLK
ncbi:MAG: DNA-formamidopyrimidine glycosylase [Acidobacteria bacterium]|nr:MAG: DNA-formamidopyrimidine glycosylase [Acidobacteriota bacterium]GIK78685.1 MAG: formamidopyrimidine-DNA glycosylase [Actinomycetes bacterium]